MRAEQESLRRELKIDRILSDLRPLIEGTTEGAERVSNIVQELKRFSATQQEDHSRFNLPAVVRTAAHWVAKAERLKPEVCLHMPEHLEVTACKGQIHQVLVNLVQNAMDVMDADPRLELACGRDGDKRVDSSARPWTGHTGTGSTARVRSFFHH